MQEQVFLELIDTHKGVILKVLHLYGDTELDRQDLYQEIVYQAWKAYPRFKGDAQFSTWLYKISLNVCLSHLRKQRTIEKHSFPQSDASTYQQRGFTEQSDLLYRCIRSLSEVDRGIILLHLEAYGNDEIAQILGMTNNHVGVKLHRIKENLKKHLTKK